MDFNIDKIAEEYNSGESSVKLAERYGMSASSVIYRLRKHGVKIRSNKQNSRRYSVNHDYFANIDSEEKAYWLGFMYADGYVTSTAGKRVGCTLSSRDAHHLELFVKCLDSDYKVNTYSGVTAYGPVEYSRVLIASDKMYDDLVRHGCVERKSSVLLPPKTLPGGLESHFIRGYIDGDGSLAVSKHTKSGLRVKIVGTKPVIEWICARVGGGIRRDSRHENVWCLDLSFDDRTWRYLYEKSTVCLERKYARAVHGHRRLSGIACDCSEFCSA